tara:strand:+ start:1604 stop:2068 length:465 start_codon:yes stop_codon:yes gene_type:complete
MKKLIILLLFIPLVSFSQDYLAFVGDKSYPSTQGFEFYNKYDEVFVSFVKTDEGSAIYIATNYIYGDIAKINKPLTLYLANGDVLISKSASATDYVDKDCISIYPLTADDISALKQHDLIRIRFTITETNTGGDEDINRFASYEDDTSESLKDF